MDEIEDSMILRSEMYSRLGKVVKQQQQIIANSCMPSRRMRLFKLHEAKNNNMSSGKMFRTVRVKVKRATSSFTSVDRSSSFNNYQPVFY